MKFPFGTVPFLGGSFQEGIDSKLWTSPSSPVVQVGSTHSKNVLVEIRIMQVQGAKTKQMLLESTTK